MKEYGIIKYYDGYCGIIISSDNTEYLLLKKELLYNEASKGDVVIFTPETISTFTETKNIARFVKRKD